MGGAGLGGPAGNIQQGCDVQVGEELALGCVVGTSKVEEGKDFNRATLVIGWSVGDAENGLSTLAEEASLAFDLLL